MMTSPTSPNSRPLRAFTLVELLIVGCLLTIVLGMAVSLSHHVRAESARSLTSDLLARLDRLASQYARAHSGQYPPVDIIPGDGSPTPTTGPAADRDRLYAATRNNRQFLLAVSGDGAFPDLPLSLYDPSTFSLRDAWGTPIVFIASAKSTLGMAPRDAPFFISAGPDRKFLTRDDNLYSYDAFPHEDQ